MDSTQPVTVKGALISTLSNTGMWGAIISTIFIIALGYALVKLHVFKTEWKAVLNSVVLKVALPALAITGFMKSISLNDLKQQGIILGVSFAFYIVLLIISKLWIKFVPQFIPKILGKKLENGGTAVESKALVMWMMLIFGSVTFFGLPIISSLYEKDGGVIAANIWTIPYRIFLYSYCFMIMSGLKMDKQNIKKSLKTAFLNPIVIATFIGLVLWLTQLIPGASSFDKNFTSGNKGWFEFSVTMPYIFKPLTYLKGLASPLVWLSIGMTLAGTKLSSAVKDKWVWIFAVQKLILIPLLVFLVMFGLNHAGLVNKAISASMVIFAAVPPATVVIAYAMQFKVNEEYAAKCSALTTLLAVVMMPLWIVASQAAFI
ncbi:AEC family transporter [[Mycoplasma] gypis]|uniref:AEC family transporter n=1 Tax=[Mycoplasma] gypis TaxID=92404 RepID=A0ABZ2RNC8_9BACT|nr:AEC family transporter [[Mycoplasma] gypis]MBN0919651.1 AEC family transporter [[Mycoplasma] gypis]